MLQRTRAGQVVPVYNEFTHRYPTFILTREENPERIIELFAKLGLRWRAERIIKLLDELSTRSGIIPDIKEELRQLPNVGDYIANAYISLHRGVKQPITDSNAVRLWSRLLGFIREEGTHKKKWFYNLCQHLTPDENFREFNYALLDLGRTVCKKNPICKKCPLTANCNYFLKMGRKGDLHPNLKSHLTRATTHQ